MAFAPRKRSKTYKKKSLKTLKKTIKPSKSLTIAVKKIMRKDVEDKTGYKEENMIAYNSKINESGDIKFVMPDVGQGSQEGNRIGDQVTARKLKINGLLNLNMIPSTNYAGQISACRIGVRIMIVQPKLYTDRASITANANSWLPYLLRKGNTAVGFNGTVPDLYAPINSEVVTKYFDKVIYLSMPLMQTQVGQQETAFSYRHFTTTLKVNNKKLLYDSNYQAGQQPTNYSPVILLGYSHVDGSTADSGHTQVNMQFNSYFDYEDA